MKNKSEISFQQFAKLSAEQLHPLGWSIWHTKGNHQCVGSMEELIFRKKYSKYSIDEGGSIAILYEKDKKEDQKVCILKVKIGKNNKNGLTIASRSNNESIYNEFKEFGEKNGWKIVSDDGKDSYVHIYSEFETPEDFQQLIALINVYDPLPELIITQLCLGNNIPLIDFKKMVIKKMVEKDSFDVVLEKAQNASQPDVSILALADILFETERYEEASKCYELITVDSDFYKKAQYQIGIIIFTLTDPGDYLSISEHAKTALPYIVEAKDYQDAPTLGQKLFNCVCYGSYQMTKKDLPFPSGAKGEMVVMLAELLAEKIHLEKTLTEENTTLKKQLAERDMSFQSPRFFK